MANTVSYNFTTADGKVIYTHNTVPYAGLSVKDMLAALIPAVADKLTALGYSAAPADWYAERLAGIPRNGGDIRLKKAPATGTRTATATAATVAPRTFEEQVADRARELVAADEDLTMRRARELATAELGAVALAGLEELADEAAARVAAAQAELDAATAAHAAAVANRDALADKLTAPAVAPVAAPVAPADEAATVAPVAPATARKRK